MGFYFESKKFQIFLIESNIYPAPMKFLVHGSIYMEVFLIFEVASHYRIRVNNPVLKSVRKNTQISFSIEKVFHLFKRLNALNSYYFWFMFLAWGI